MSQTLWAQHRKVFWKIKSGQLGEHFGARFSSSFMSCLFLIFDLKYCNNVLFLIYELALLDQWITQNKSNVICCVDM
jgi:hypothetical protein